jgi:hypothetical protein
MQWGLPAAASPHRGQIVPRLGLRRVPGDGPLPNHYPGQYRYSENVSPGERWRAEPTTPERRATRARNRARRCMGIPPAPTRHIGCKIAQFPNEYAQIGLLLRLHRLSVECAVRFCKTHTPVRSVKSAVVIARPVLVERVFHKVWLPRVLFNRCSRQRGAPDDEAKGRTS